MRIARWIGDLVRITYLFAVTSLFASSLSRARRSIQSFCSSTSRGFRPTLGLLDPAKVTSLPFRFLSVNQGPTRLDLFAPTCLHSNASRYIPFIPSYPSTDRSRYHSHLFANLSTDPFRLRNYQPVLLSSLLCSTLSSVPRRGHRLEDATRGLARQVSDSLVME